MLYSIKMRSSLGGIHGRGGRHISGAERIVPEEGVEHSVLAMVRRAERHERGAADFIQVKIERVHHDDISYCPLLSVTDCAADSKESGRERGVSELVRAGVTEKAARKGMAALTSLSDSMRGAMVVDAESGRRLDSLAARGVRCSNMDCEDLEAYTEALRQRGMKGDHAREALVLASKVASAPGMVAELCWSDDPGYVTGYVGSPKNGYCRIPVMKEKGDPLGGRVFFVRPGTDVDALDDYLQNQVVLVRV